MVSVIKVGDLEVMRDDGGDDFRAYSVVREDEVLLSNAHFKEAIDFANSRVQNKVDEVKEEDVKHKLPVTIEAVFLYNRDSAIIEASMTREEAESVFREESNCIPKLGSVLMMSAEGSEELKEKTVVSTEIVGEKTLIIFLEGK